MQRLSFAFLALFTALASGCIVVSPTPHPTGGSEPQVALGPSGQPGYHVLAGGSTSLPSGDIGFLVTANGGGGFRIVWTDTLNSPAQFHGAVSCDSSFDAAQTRGFSGAENLTFVAANQITFNSVPGANVDGVDLVANTEPIYLDALIDGSRVAVNIYFTGASTGVIVNSAFDPVAFTSP